MQAADSSRSHARIIQSWLCLRFDNKWNVLARIVDDDTRDAARKAHHIT